MFLFFLIFHLLYIGEILFCALYPYLPPFIFKIFPSSGGFIFRALYLFSRTLVRFEKERLFLYRTKVFILYHAKVHNYSRPAYPYFTCKNMANYFIAGEVTATISSNNLPFHTPYITPIVITWNIQFSMFCNLNFDYTWL